MIRVFRTSSGSSGRNLNIRKRPAQETGTVPKLHGSSVFKTGFSIKKITDPWNPELLNTTDLQDIWAHWQSSSAEFNIVQMAVYWPAVRQTRSSNLDPAFPWRSNWAMGMGENLKDLCAYVMNKWFIEYIYMYAAGLSRRGEEGTPSPRRRPPQRPAYQSEALPAASRISGKTIFFIRVWNHWFSSSKEFKKKFI